MKDYVLKIGESQILSAIAILKNNFVHLPSAILWNLYPDHKVIIIDYRL